MAPMQRTVVNASTGVVSSTPGKEAMMKTPSILRHTLACLSHVATKCQHLLPGCTPRGRPPTHTDRSTPRHVREGGMLVESDVTQGVRGILP